EFGASQGPRLCDVRRGERTAHALALKVSLARPKVSHIRPHLPAISSAILSRVSNNRRPVPGRPGPAPATRPYRVTTTACDNARDDVIGSQLDRLGLWLSSSSTSHRSTFNLWGVGNPHCSGPGPVTRAGFETRV